MYNLFFASLYDHAVNTLVYPYWVTHRENKNGSISILFFDKIGLRLNSNTKGMYIEIMKDYLADPDYLDYYGLEFKLQPGDYIRFTLHQPQDILLFTEAINDAWLDAAKSTERFGCCHAFMKCSDEKKCIHEGKNTEQGRRCWGCMYHWNLLAGRIFYGKNANQEG